MLSFVTNYLPVVMLLGQLWFGVLGLGHGFTGLVLIDTFCLALSVEFEVLSQPVHSWSGEMHTVG